MDASTSTRQWLLCKRQTWVQGAVESYGVVVNKTPREKNVAELFTQAVSVKDASGFLESIIVVKRSVH